MSIDNYDAPSCAARVLNTYPPQTSALKNAINQSNNVNDSTVIASFNRSCELAENPTFNKDFGVISNRVLQDDRNNSVAQKTTGSLNYSLKPFPKNVVIGSAANSGIGLSTTLALLASNIASKKYVVALIDADISEWRFRCSTWIGARRRQKIARGSSSFRKIRRLRFALRAFALEQCGYSGLLTLEKSGA